MIDKEKLKYYREKNNYTTSDLSKKLKCSKKIIELWEKGISTPKEKDIVILCDLYNIELIDLKVKEKVKIINLKIFIISIIIAIIFSIFSKDIITLILLTIMLYIIILTSIYIYQNYKLKCPKIVPKTIFGIVLSINDKNQRLKDYLLESNFISCIYISIYLITKSLNIADFILKIDIISNKSVNEVIILILTYLLLLVTLFIIELGFGEYIIKMYRGDKIENKFK